MNQEQDSLFTLSIVTENEASTLVRLTTTMARHRIRIESLTSTCDDAARISRHVVLVRAVPDRVRRAMKQVSACVGVLVANYYSEGETVDREVALFKLEADRGEGEDALRELVRTRRARVIVSGEDYLILEKTGCGREVREFYESLRPFGVMEFIRSGRIMVTKMGPGELAEIRAESRGGVVETPF